jgi:hypothetical protein
MGWTIPIALQARPQTDPVGAGGRWPQSVEQFEILVEAVQHELVHFAFCCLRSLNATIILRNDSSWTAASKKDGATRWGPGLSFGFRPLLLLCSSLCPTNRSTSVPARAAT